MEYRMNIYVGNLSFRTMETDIRKVFEQYGEVSRVNLITDRDSGQPRGFGFVEMPSRTEAQAAINALNGVDLGGRSLAVNEAKPRTNGGGQGGRRPSGNDRQGAGFNNFNRKGW